MPTIRILAAEPAYHALTKEQRRSLAEKLRETTAIILQTDIAGVEAFWLAPFDPDCAVNTLPYSIDVEFSPQIGPVSMQDFADALLHVFWSFEHIPEGYGYGVWITIPSISLWKEAEKRKGPLD